MIAVLDEPRELALVNKARVALEQAKTIDEVKDIRNKAEAIRAYLKQCKACMSAQNAAAEVKLLAERRAGEMLVGMERQQAGRPEKRFHDGTISEPTLSDIGVDKKQSHRFQRIASIPQQMFDDYIIKTQAAQKELTSHGALKLAEIHRQRTAVHDTSEAESYGIVTDLQSLIDRGAKFPTIYADPPWAYDNNSTRAAVGGTQQRHVDSGCAYKSTMSVDEICAEPVSQLVTENAHLHLWTTNAFLFDAKRVLEAWGFTYKSCFVWVKPQMGIGNYWRVSHEFMLLGIRGKLRFAERDEKSWAEIDRGQHSRKPKEVRRKIERVSPGPYLELYGREPLDAPWTVYGNEVVKGLC